LTDGGEMLHHLLRDSIKLRYRSDVPVGISLSGGLDSGGLVCIASDMARKGELQMPDGLRTFTAGTEDPALNEAPAAALLSSENGGRPSSVCPTAAELRGDLNELVRGHDEPVRSLSTYMQFRVMRLARENGTVVILSGQGPDELLWGYPWQYPYAWRDLAASGQVLRSVGALVDASRHATVPLTQLLGYAAYAIAPGMRVGRYWSRIGRFLSREIKEDVKAASLVRACFRSLDGSAHFRQEVESTGLPSLLRYEDRNSMAFSVESRLPYLDPRILDLAYSVPSWTRVQGGWSKAILREALARVAPPELVWKRKKLGFGAPEVAFLTALIPEIQAAFSDSPRSASLLNPQAVRSRIDESVTPPTFMWRFLNLELWMRAYELAP
jgi:asparagine synthase (glutamine-hydrolysing)